MEGNATGEPSWADKDMNVGQGRQTGGASWHRNVIRCRQVARGEVTSAEAGGQQVQAKFRWVDLCTGRGGGEQVKIERA